MHRYSSDESSSPVNAICNICLIICEQWNRRVYSRVSRIDQLDKLQNLVIRVILHLSTTPSSNQTANLFSFMKGGIVSSLKFSLKYLTAKGCMHTSREKCWQSCTRNERKLAHERPCDLPWPHWPPGQSYEYLRSSLFAGGRKNILGAFVCRQRIEITRKIFSYDDC